jgi:hypothetical protein
VIEYKNQKEGGNMITLQYNLNNDDYQKLLRTNQGHPIKKYIPVIAAVVLVFFFTVIPIVVDVNWAAVSSVLSILGGVFFGGLIGVVLSLYFQKQLTIKNANSTAWKSDTTLEACDEYLLFRNIYSETKLNWISFSECKETPEHFFINLAENKTCYYVIPKRGFASAVDMDEFRSLTRTKLSLVQAANVKPNIFESKNYIVYLLLIVAILAMIFTQIKQSTH